MDLQMCAVLPRGKGPRGGTYGLKALVAKSETNCARVEIWGHQEETTPIRAPALTILVIDSASDGTLNICV